MGASYNNKVKHIILDLMQMKNFCEDPLIIKKGKGARIWDIEGKEYLDALSGIFVTCLGHGNERIIEAIKKQHERIAFVAPLHAVCDITVEYAYKLSQIMPGDLNTIKLLMGGSETTEGAMRMARQYHNQTGNPGKYKVIGVYGEFHGGTMGALSATGLAGPRRSKAEPLMAGFYHVEPPLCSKCEYELKYPSCKCLCAKILAKTIERQDPNTVSSVIIEPISNTGGIVVPPKGYLEIIRKACTNNNVLLIFDEVITGFGRTGEWFAAQTFEVTPDIICTGKGMSGGYAPLACISISDSIYYDGFWADESEGREFPGGHTYGTNPISAAAGLAVLEEIENNNLIEKGRIMGEYTRKLLKEGVENLGVLEEVRGKGMLVGVQLAHNSKTNKLFKESPDLGKRMNKRALKNGLILRTGSDWLAIAPPLNIAKSEIEEIIERFIKTIKDELI